MIVFSQNNLSRNFSAVLLFFYKVRCYTYKVLKIPRKIAFKVEKWFSALNTLKETKEKVSNNKEER